MDKTTLHNYILRFYIFNPRFVKWDIAPGYRIVQDGTGSFFFNSLGCKFLNPQFQVISKTVGTVAAMEFSWSSWPWGRVRQCFTRTQRV